MRRPILLALIYLVTCSPSLAGEEKYVQKDQYSRFRHTQNLRREYFQIGKNSRNAIGFMGLNRNQVRGLIYPETLTEIDQKGDLNNSFFTSHYVSFYPGVGELEDTSFEIKNGIVTKVFGLTDKKLAPIQKWWGPCTSTTSKHYIWEKPHYRLMLTKKPFPDPNPPQMFVLEIETKDMNGILKDRRDSISKLKDELLNPNY